MSALPQYANADRRLSAMRSPVVVSASDLVRRYGEGDAGVDALRGVSLEIEEGSLTAIMGPSGSGKSTLMHILAGLDKPTEGSVWIAGLEISSMHDRELTRLRREHIGFVFQFFNLLPMLTAEENVLLPVSIAGVKPDRAWVEELLLQTYLFAGFPRALNATREWRRVVPVSAPDDDARTIDDWRRDRV